MSHPSSAQTKLTLSTYLFLVSFCALSFFVFSTRAEAASGNSFFAGTVLSVAPCINSANSLVTVGTSASTFVYQPGASQSVPANTPPSVGTTVTGVLGTGSFVCQTGGVGTASVSAPVILYVAQANQTVTAAPAPAATSNSFSGSNIFSMIFSKLGGAFASLFSKSMNPAAQGAALGNANSSGGGLGATLSYGGAVTTSFFCSCSTNFLLTVTGSGGARQFMYQPGMPQYKNSSLPRPGVWALFNYTPGGICMIPSGDSCAPFGAPQGTISRTVGTSLTL